MESKVPLNKRGGDQRWVIPLVVIVLIAVAGVIATTFLIGRCPALEPEAGIARSNDPVLPVDDRAAIVPADAVPANAAQVSPIGTEIGMTAPGFTLEDLDGKSVSLYAFRGQVVLLNFWASWCRPCRNAMPALMELFNRYKDQGLVMVGVSLDRTREDAAAYIAETGYDEMVALWGSLSAAQGVARAYGIPGVPHIFIIDRDGIIRFSAHPARLTSADIEPLL